MTASNKISVAHDGASRKQLMPSTLNITALLCSLLFGSTCVFASLEDHGLSLGGAILCMFAFMITFPIAFFCTLLSTIRYGARQWKWGGVSLFIFAISLFAPATVDFLQRLFHLK